MRTFLEGLLVKVNYFYLQAPQVVYVEELQDDLNKTCLSLDKITKA